MSDTYAGAFFGIPPTGRRLAVRQAHMLRLHHRVIGEHWAVRDVLGVLVQLGAVEPSHALVRCRC
jgi:predicted ester cyclase